MTKIRKSIWLGWILMKTSKKDIRFRGRYLGILILVIIQFIVGLIHFIFGLVMITEYYSVTTFSTLSMVYSIYTLVYALLTKFFTYLLWMGKRFGWIGTVAVSLFIIIVDTLAVFDLVNILSIPVPIMAAIGEIPFSILVLVYLLQNHVRAKYNI
jgi:hypothetical protein